MHLEAAQFLERVDDDVLVGAEGHRRARVVQGARPGPMPSARSRSVVGQKQAPVPVPPSSSMSRSVRCVAWMLVRSWPSAPASSSSSVGVQP